ncbi:MAG: hydroxymethylglutaryl-CoA lyase, partial [Flavobacteriales bacterium]
MIYVECPRDAMQGVHEFIPTELKIKYLNSLLKVGYDILDFGSFVSPKAIPQLRDTENVLEKLDLEQSNTELLAIVANVRGAKTACQFDQIQHLGFPLSVSETFQQRNTKKSIAQALESIEELQNLTNKHNKTSHIYLSMGFGNPYGDAFHPDLLAELSLKLCALGIRSIIPSDTIGVAKAEQIKTQFEFLHQEFNDVTWGAHLHSRPEHSIEKIDAVFNSPCGRLDFAIQGFGGCPMAKDDLTGNMPTEKMVSYFNTVKADTNVNAM